ncbi:MAG: integrase arm-type DNA-binding domain-containing protein [Deltaproteobacteria bacterium]|nr:integrase arm-type DNA-binding domain-containing protein [Deltaproteobacteria bacterium]
MALTDTTVRQAKPRPKAFKLADSRGLCLEVTPTGAKRWRLRYRFEGKEKLISLGLYPDVGLKDARERRDEARKVLANGIDPSAARKAAKAAKADTFEAVALDWYARQKSTWSVKHAAVVLGRLSHDIFPALGARPIAEISAPELLAILRRIEARGAVETAHRLKQSCGQVFRFAIAEGKAVRDPSADLRDALTPTGKDKHHASVKEPKKIGALLRAIEGYDGAFVTLCALRLAPLVFVRPGELRRAEWAEFDLDSAEWRIPGPKMKMGGPHIVPLSRQALVALRGLHPLTGAGRYLFPGARSADRPMSENTVNAALRRMGYGQDEMTGHGFRSMASTLLNEQGWHRDAIERQLAHGERSKVRAAYNYAEHLPERRRMMQSWADYLDRLREGDEVVAFPGKAAQ